MVSVLDEHAITPPRAVANLAVADDYCSWAGPGQWIAYDFKEKLVWTTHYTLKAFVGSFSGAMEAWVIEGSVDGLVWAEMSKVEHCRELNVRGTVMTFRIERPGWCRIWKLRQAPWNESTNSNLRLSAIELFGELKE
jgi:hypothetical protein